MLEQLNDSHPLTKTKKKEKEKKMETFQMSLHSCRKDLPRRIIEWASTLSSWISNMSQRWRIPHFSGEIIPMADCSNCEKFSPALNCHFPRSKLYALHLIFSIWLLVRRESPSPSGEAILEILNIVVPVHPPTSFFSQSWTNQALSVFLHVASFLVLWLSLCPFSGPLQPVHSFSAYQGPKLNTAFKAWQAEWSGTITIFSSAGDAFVDTT